MSVHKDPKRKTWYVKYLNKTKRGFQSKSEAQKYEAQLICQKEMDATLPKIELAEKTQYYDLLDCYLKYKKTTIQYSSFVKYEEGIRLYIKTMFADKSIDSITSFDCFDFRDKIDSLVLATSYKNFLLREFKETFRFAVENHMLTENPSLLLMPFKKTADDLALKKAKELSVWNADSFNRFIRCVEGESFQALFIILFFTGCRLGEALALSWHDYQDKSLSVTKSYTKKTAHGTYAIKVPKSTNSIRTISLNEYVCNYLNGYREKQMIKEGFSEDWFIFGGIKPLAETTIQKHFAKAIQKSGVKKIRVHDLRHSHATILINNGINIVAVSRRLGHSDVNMTLKVYTHLLQKRDEKMMDFLDKSSHSLLTIG